MRSTLEWKSGVCRNPILRGDCTWFCLNTHGSPLSLGPCLGQRRGLGSYVDDIFPPSDRSPSCHKARGRSSLYARHLAITTFTLLNTQSGTGTRLETGYVYDAMHCCSGSLSTSQHLLHDASAVLLDSSFLLGVSPEAQPSALAFSLDLVAVGFMLGLELEVRMGWAQEHLTAAVSVNSVNHSIKSLHT
jgi:hypothetical protein